MEFTNKYDVKVLKSLVKYIKMEHMVWPEIIRSNRKGILAALQNAIDTGEVAICHGGLPTLIDQSSAIQRDLFSNQSSSTTNP